MSLKLILREELDRKFKQTALKFFTEKLGIKSKVLMNNGESNVKSEKKVADISFPKSGIFTLDIDDKDSFDFIRKLAHELVHVKQIEDKRLKLINLGMVEFDKKVYDLSKYSENFKSDNDTPFDREANQKEKVLANAYWNNLSLNEGFESLKPTPSLNPNISSYKVQMVRIDSLEAENAVGEDRVKKPIMMGNVNYSEKNIAKLMVDIKINGFKEACIMAYDPDSSEATIIEGNHRIEAAKRLGLKYVPVKIETMRIRSNYERSKDNMFPLSTASAFLKDKNNKKPQLVSDLHFFKVRDIFSYDYIETKPTQQSFFNNVDIEKGDFKS